MCWEGGLGGLGGLRDRKFLVWERKKKKSALQAKKGKGDVT